MPNVPVMPAGQPEVASVTAELKPLPGTTVTLDVPYVPATTVAALAFKAKLEPAVTVREIEVLADDAPLVPFTVSE